MILKITGIIKSGLGEGVYFISLRHYNDEIKNKLGFNPFKGTLNIEVEEKESKDFLKNIEKSKVIVISGFEQNGRKFGSAKCVMAKIKDIEGAVIIPEISRHKDIIEFISHINLRERFKLKDNDAVTVEVI